MATVYDPIAKDESLNTTEATPRNIADVIAEGLKGIEDALPTYTEGDGIDISAQKVISVDTTFTEASTRANIASGDPLSTIWGKIKKFFTDLKAVAFSGAASDVSYGSGSVEDALDGLEWKHKSVSLSPTSISTTSTDITVPEIVGAKEVVAIVDLASLYIIGIENKDVYGTLASLIGNSNHQLAGDLRINVTTGVVGIRCSLKGSSRQYPTLTDLYYR